MENDFEKQLKNSADHIRLSEAEKGRARERVREYMAHKPLRRAAESTTPGAIPSPFSWVKRFEIAGATLLILVLVGGGVFWGAETSVPGDLLYPVKRGVNEGILESFNNSPEDKAGLRVKQFERRLDEAGKIFNTSDTTNNAPRQSAVIMELEEAAAEADAEIRVLGESNPTQAEVLRVQLENSIDSFEAALPPGVADDGSGASESDSATSSPQFIPTLPVPEEESSKIEN